MDDMSEEYYRSIAWGFKNGVLYEYIQDNDRFYNVSEMGMGTDTEFFDTPEEARASFWEACEWLYKPKKALKRSPDT